MSEQVDPARGVKQIPPFVGRAQELGLLASWLGEAASGQPRVVLIEGEPGIGKTRLFQEIRALGARLHMQALVGRCYEDLALPYLPFADSLFPQLASMTPQSASESADLASIAHLLHSPPD